MNETITIVGNISQPEVRHTPSGPVTSFGLATTQRKRDPETGAWSDGQTSWYRVSVYRRLGENAMSSLHRGDRVIVTGRLRLSTWENSTGRGMAADVDADAVGHDLLWGTTRYTRGSGHAAPAAPVQEGETRAGTPAADSTAWAAPMSSDEAGSAFERHRDPETYSETSNELADATPF